MDVALDASELEGLSEDDLRKRYDAANRGSAGVPGGGRAEDFSDLVAKEAGRRKQKMERERERERDRKKESFKF